MLQTSDNENFYPEFLDDENGRPIHKV